MKKTSFELTEKQITLLEKEGFRDTIENSNGGLLVAQVFLLPTSKKDASVPDGLVGLALVEPPHSTKIEKVFEDIEAAEIQERTWEIIFGMLSKGKHNGR